MKPLIVLIRIIVIGCFWSVFFLEGIRVIMLRNWRFDIISSEHWQYAWDLWMNGWVIADAKEWAFVLIIVTFIPLWLTGWAALSLVAWENIILSIILLPIKLFQNIFHKPIIGIKKIKYAATPIKKKPSYKEIRPRAIRPVADEPIGDSFINPVPLKKSTLKQARPIFQETVPEKPGVFEHSLLSIENDDDDFVFNFDAFDVEPKEEQKPKEEIRQEKPSHNKKAKDRSERTDRESGKDNRNKDRDNKRENKKDRDYDRDNKKNDRSKNDKIINRDETLSKPGSSNIIEIMNQKGYQVITGTTIKNTLVDFIGVGKDKLCICLLDREAGDWLADEERFNDEEPLWFSESSHRISPVRKIDIVKKHLQGIFSIDNYRPLMEAYVIVQLGNIINAEDMFDIWNDMDIKVTRIDRGSPKDIMLFAKGLSDAGSPASDKEFEKVKKLIRK